VAPITQDYNTAVTAPADPTRTGYTFAGWIPTVPNTMPASDTNCVAQWTINQYTISFDSNGGSAVAPITQDYNTAVTAPADPTKTGYSFTGWYSDQELTTAYTFTTMPAEDITLYAQWTASDIDITINPDAGEDTTGSAYNLTSEDLDLLVASDSSTTTTTAHLTPTDGTDTTGSGTYTLIQSDLDELHSSDNSKYMTDDTWDYQYSDNDRLEFGFGDIPTDAISVSAGITLEWRRTNSIDEARIYVFDGSTWTQHNLTVPGNTNDTTQTISLPEVNSAEKANAMRLRWQVDDYWLDGSAQTEHDLLCVDVTYTTTSGRYQVQGMWQNGSFTDYMTPTGGTDTTSNSSSTLDSTDLGYLVTNNGSPRYQSDYYWDTSYSDTDVLDFTFDTIGAETTVTGVTLNFDWRWHGSNGQTAQYARIRVYDGSSWTNHTLVVPLEDNDSLATISLTEINTTNKFNAMIVRFQVDASNTANNVNTQHDWVQVDVTYMVNEHLDLAFPDIPSDATVNTAELKYEWQRSSDVTSATLYISSDDGSSWTSYTISPLPSASVDSTITLDLVTLFSIDSAAELNGLEVRLQVNGASGNPVTKHDWIQINVNYTP
jgi:uncharacterized repeat protein (TIGR02543 family)